MKPVVALVTARAARGLDEDLPPLAAALQAAGVRMEVVDWDDPTVDWESFDLALLRSTWDYTERLREFLVWVDATARRTTVLNPPSVVRWNTDKHYLAISPAPLCRCRWCRAPSLSRERAPSGRWTPFWRGMTAPSLSSNRPSVPTRVTPSATRGPESSQR